MALGLSPRLGNAAPHRHPQKQEFKRQIADLEQQWRIATLTADLPLMDRLLSEDYVGISMTGQVNTKAMQLERLRKSTLVINKIYLSDLRIKLVGSVAIVTSRAEVEGVNDGVSMNGTFRYIRVYQRLPSGVWKITNFEPTRVPVRGEHVARARAKVPLA